MSAAAGAPDAGSAASRRRLSRDRYRLPVGRAERRSAGSGSLRCGNRPSYPLRTCPLPSRPSLSARLARRWARLYTSGLPPVIRDRRRAEIECEVWEWENAASSTAGVDPVIALRRE